MEKIHGRLELCKKETYQEFCIYNTNETNTKHAQLTTSLNAHIHFNNGRLGGSGRTQGL